MSLIIKCRNVEQRRRVIIELEKLGIHRLRMPFSNYRWAESMSVMVLKRKTFNPINLNLCELAVWRLAGNTEDGCIEELP